MITRGTTDHNHTVDLINKLMFIYAFFTYIFKRGEENKPCKWVEGLSQQQIDINFAIGFDILYTLVEADKNFLTPREQEIIRVWRNNLGYNHYPKLTNSAKNAFTIAIELRKGQSKFRLTMHDFMKWCRSAVVLLSDKNRTMYNDTNFEGDRTDHFDVRVDYQLKETFEPLYDRFLRPTKHGEQP